MARRFARRGASGDARAIRRKSSARSREPADIVAMVHGETSTGVVNPVHEIAAIAQAHGALTIVDAVTSLGGVPLTPAAWGIDVCYSCTQKGLGAPSGLAPITFSTRALDRRACRRAASIWISALLEDYWVRRKYHHTISAPLIYALHEALAGGRRGRAGGALGAARASSSALAAGLDALGVVAAAAARASAVDVERRARAGRRRRGGRAPRAARRVRHRDRRRASGRSPARSGASA